MSSNNEAPESLPKKLTDRQRLGQVVKLLPTFIEACQWGSGPRVVKIFTELADLIQPTHPGAGKQLLEMAERRSTVKKVAPLPEKIVHVEEARIRLQDIILPEDVEETLTDLIREHQRRNELAAFDLSPRHRILLHGTPGNGKTLAAEALAHALELPLLRVKYGGLIASHLGETGRNLDALFDYAAIGKCLVFLDEFDGLGIQRGHGQDVTEVRRITNHLLIVLERLPSTCVLVAATNAAHLIDTALIRRFDLKIEIPAPDAALRRRCAARELAPEKTPGHDLSGLAERIAAMPLANLFEVVELCKRLRRDLVLNDGRGVHALLQTG